MHTPSFEADSGGKLPLRETKNVNDKSEEYYDQLYAKWLAGDNSVFFNADEETKYQLKVRAYAPAFKDAHKYIAAGAATGLAGVSPAAALEAIEIATIGTSTTIVTSGAAGGAAAAGGATAIFGGLSLKAKDLVDKIFKGKGTGSLDDLLKQKSLGKGSTGRTTPNNLQEQLSMKEVLSNPLEGATQVPLKNMNDSRWLGSEGWVKMQRVVKTSEGNVTIHFNYNTKTAQFDDFKFK